MPPLGLKAGPVTRVCHVCGRSYGLSSFDIHLKQCKKLFLSQEELKPVSQRRQLPKTPPGLGQCDPGEVGIQPTREMVDEMNRAAQETFNIHGMEKCELCGRTFNEGRLAIHQRSCRPGHVAKRVDDGAAPRNKKPEVDYGRVSNTDHSTAEAITLTQATQSSGVSQLEASLTRPTTSSGSGGRVLSGSLATNRIKKGGVQSPLSQGLSESINVETLRQELQKSTVNNTPGRSMVSLIQAKLDHWEATTLTTLQEIRDLKQLFAQLH